MPAKKWRLIHETKTASLDLFSSLGDKELSTEKIQQLAFKTGFQKRTPRKIHAIDFLSLLCIESVKGSPSFNDLAGRMEALRGVSATKQAFWKKLDESCVEFFQAVLAKVIRTKISNHSIPTCQPHTSYQRILVQDSTIIRLPFRLFDAFSGVFNAHCAVCNARIQSVYDLLSGQFVAFSIDPYSKNDTLAAPELDLHKGDLVLRDRGYLSSGEIRRHQNAQADCIYRHKHKTSYLHPQTREPLNLSTILKREGRLDMVVLLNDDDQTPVRLVATPVEEEIANLRRMKLKKEIKGHSPSAELLRLMSWTIFITTIPLSKASFRELLAMYGLRWRIENIFKTWKSNMHFAAIHNVSANQLRAILIARLTMIVISIHRIFKPCCQLLHTRYGQELSMMKFMKYIQTNSERIPELLDILNNGDNSAFLHTLSRYCAYEKRKRQNYAQIKEQILRNFALS